MEPLARHQCMIYEGSAYDRLPRLVPLILQKLDHRNRCLILGSEPVMAKLGSDLSASGLDVPAQLQKGALILSSDRSHLRDGYFDVEAMLAGLADAVQEALADGFEGFFATGDMTWEFGSEVNLPKLLQYECGLERLFRKLPALSGICQYHKDTLPLDMIGNALYTHRAVYVNHTLQRVNPYYLQPESLQIHRPPITSSEVQRRYQELAVA
jgi:hypothetical protein